MKSQLTELTAHLKYDVPVETVAHSDFDSMDRMVQDEAWNDPDLEPWSLFVALDDDYTRSAGLPTSQRWPWDSHKGAYIPRGAHDLHCVVSLDEPTLSSSGDKAFADILSSTILACSPLSGQREPRRSATEQSDLAVRPCNPLP